MHLVVLVAADKHESNNNKHGAKHRCSLFCGLHVSVAEWRLLSAFL